MACSAVGRRTGRDPRIRQTNTSSDAGGDPFFRYRACPVDLPYRKTTSELSFWGGVGNAACVKLRALLRYHTL